MTGLALALAAIGCGDEPPPPQSPPDDVGAPTVALMKTLRSWEYRNTITALLGDAVTVPEQWLPTDLVRANFSSISASQDCYGDVQVEAFEMAALDVAAQAFEASPNPLEAVGCEPAAATDACVEDFLARFGRSAWRRPLSESERLEYVELADSLTTIMQGDVIEGVELTVAAMLQSPYFLYRVELGEASPEEPPALRYDSFEMATRLAYTLWETTPDEALLDAAAVGELLTEESVREHATRMLEDPRADRVLERFWREHLNIDRLTLEDYPKPDATGTLYEDMRLEGHLLAARLSEPGADALDFIRSDEAFLTPELAAHYGIGETIASPQWVSLPDERRGYLLSGLFLAANSHASETSPTRRGRFVVERILCRVVPPPPPDVDISLPEIEPGLLTRREQLQMHSAEPACSGCHQIMDPPGFAFEQFDPLGRGRSADQGLPIDASGELDGESFDGAAELVSILADSEDVPHCLARQVFRSTLGQLEAAEQEDYLDGLSERFVANGHELRALVVDIVSSRPFRYARPEAAE